jgi:hypothetical protein
VPRKLGLGRSRSCQDGAGPIKKASRGRKSATPNERCRRKDC